MKIICLEFFGGSSKNENSKIWVSGVGVLRKLKMKIQKSEWRSGGYCEAAKPVGWGTGTCEARSLKPWSFESLHIYFVYMYSVYKTWWVRSWLVAVEVYDLKFMTWSLWPEVYDLKFMTWSLWPLIFYMYDIHMIYVWGFSRGGFASACWFWGGWKKEKEWGIFWWDFWSDFFEDFW